MKQAPRPARRSWWMEEALSHPEFVGPESPPLRGDTKADVVILGGGYTGMWTAYFLKAAAGQAVAMAGSATVGGATSRMSPRPTATPMRWSC